jgi:hypothetical protein
MGYIKKTQTVSIQHERFLLLVKSKKLKNIRIITEKDISFLDEISQDSLDYKLSYYNNNKKTHFLTNGSYSLKIEKFLPKFDFAKTAAASKVEIIAPLPHTDVMKIYFNFLKMNIIKKTEDIKFFNYEETKNIYKNLPDDLKWMANDIVEERATSVMTVYVDYNYESIQIFPCFFNYWITSEIYDKKNNEYRFYIKNTIGDHGDESNIFIF